MTPKQFEGIIVNGAQLAQEIAYGEGLSFLDFETGEIVPAIDCPKSDFGNGHLALSRGKRFIYISSYSEHQHARKQRYDNMEFGSHLDDSLRRDPLPADLREALDREIDEIRDSDEYREFCDYLHEDLAAEEAALQWIVYLRPSVMVGWYEEGLGVTQVYDPVVETWVDA